MAYTKDKWVRRFLIPETARHRKGFTVYKVTSVVYARSSREEASKVSVWKRYNDFKKLHSELGTLYTRSQGKESFPPFARANFFGRFEVEVIEERKQHALRLLDFISKHACLYSSEAFIKFFETSHSYNYINDRSLSLSSDTSEDDRKSTLNSSNTPRHTVPSPPFISRHNRKGSVQSVSERDEVVSLSHSHVDENPYGKPRILDVKNVPDRNTKLTAAIVSGKNPEKPETSNADNDTVANGTIKVQPVVNTGSNNHSSTTTLHDGTDLPLTQEDASYYIFIAAAHMSAAFRHEAIAEYEEAFTQYKMGISNLLNGVKSDPDTVRVEIIKEKISKYLERAERLYNRHLNCNVSSLSKPILELQYYKVLRVIKSVMLVKDIRDSCLKIVKTIERPSDSVDSIDNYILRGQIPYLVKLYACIETETGVYLVLQYASRGKLWDYVKSHCNIRVKSHSAKEHSHSFNCIPDSDNSSHVYLWSEGQRSKTINSTATTRRIDLKCGNDIGARLEAGKGRKYESRDDSDVSTAQLLEKAQKLLQSVNATLRKSNSIANRLNEYSHLVCHCDNFNCTNVRNGKNETNGSQDGHNSRDGACRTAKKDKSGTAESKSDLRECLINNNSIDFFFSENKLFGPYNRLESHSVDSSKRGSADANYLRANNIHGSLDSRVVDLLPNNENQLGSEEELWQIPEATIRLWAAEILLALEALHQQEVIIADLRPDNILIDDNGHVRLTYIIPRYRTEFLKFKEPYSAPELCIFSPVILSTTSADIWSFGVILYELLTGSEFLSKHSGSFHTHSIVNLPRRLSTSAKSLLNSVLKYQPNDRLTIPEIKKHPFFDDLDWSHLVNP